MTSTKPLSDLRHDDRGAMMLTGIFMSCFLIGSLWFLIGIGDTVVFRDKMQEAADHGAFTSAALHAKGMNFIALCNLVLLAGVTVHIVLGIIHDIGLAICILSIGFKCGFWVDVRKAYMGYFSLLRPAARTIHVVEVVAAYGFPVMGFVEGVTVGATYDGGRGAGSASVIPLSTSLVRGPANKEGLPVAAAPMSSLCRKIATVGFTEVFNKALGISTTSPGNLVIDLVKSIIGAVVEFRYCNDLGHSAAQESQNQLVEQFGKGNDRIDEENARIDEVNANRHVGDPIQDRVERARVGNGTSAGGFDPGFDSFWGDAGPLFVWGAAANGNDWFQVWGINTSPELTDASESRVGIGRGMLLGMQKYETKRHDLTYFAQAEFYFDCDSVWTEPQCNYEDNAMFQIKWRARLRRLSPSNLTAMLASAGIEALTSLPAYNDFKKQQGKFDSQTQSIFKRETTRTYIDYVTRQAERATKITTSTATKALGVGSGVYH
ncbi:MAG TPA: hypothetical protein VM580_33330 [Labilithrix sp.]|nr:hypothetical protein [Labilithrix sp.]